jgi:hypothetical protein
MRAGVVRRALLFKTSRLGRKNIVSRIMVTMSRITTMIPA